MLRVFSRSRPVWYSEGWLHGVLELAVHGSVLDVLGPKPVEDRPSLTLSGFSVRKNDMIYVVLSIYQPGLPQHTLNSSTVDVTYTVPCVGCTVGSTHTQYSLNTSNSVYDQLYRDLSAQGLLRYDDGMVYSLGGMATTEGVSWVHQHAEPYFAMQKAAFTAAPFAGSVAAGSTDLDVTVSMPLQGTIMIVLDAAVN